jgi:hypothetical protein
MVNNSTNIKKKQQKTSRLLPSITEHKKNKWRWKPRQNTFHKFVVIDIDYIE